MSRMSESKPDLVPVPASAVPEVVERKKPGLFEILNRPIPLPFGKHRAPETAAKRLQFIEHPLWRTYVFVYTEGEALLRRWLDAAPAGERAARFGRLLREPLTPVAIEAEIAAAG